jgi:hypothetical protein
VSERRYEVRQAFRVLDVGALGGMLTEYAFENYRVTEEGKTDERLQAPWTLRIDPDGKVLERIIGPEVIEDFPFPLPGRPVRIGESWSRKSGWSSGDITSQGTGMYTLAGVGMSADGRTAQIRFTMDGVARSSPSSVISTRGTSKLTGEYEWLIEKGRLGKYSSEIAVTADSYVSLPGVSASLRLSSRGTMRGSPLAPDQVSIVPVPADLMVVPAQGIGPATLAATVEDLTKQHGPSDYRELDLGYLAWSRRWRNGLVAYVSGDDNNKVLGLEIGDGRYRTDKGIGVGSSQGAVLLAYGRKPHRLEMTMPGYGPMRILVYNDLGIAFGVVSEAVLAARSFTPIPAGLVRWVTVFPPRAAARIYPMPGAQ